MLSQAFIQVLADSPRFQAFETLLDRPDPPDLGPRRHRVTQYGKPNRDNEIFRPLLLLWLAHLRSETEPSRARVIRYRNYYTGST